MGLVRDHTHIKQCFSSITEFAITMDDAEMAASTDWEAQFVANLKERFLKYGDAMVITEKQAAILRKIAGPDD